MCSLYFYKPNHFSTFSVITIQTKDFQKSSNKKRTKWEVTENTSDRWNCLNTFSFSKWKQPKICLGRCCVRFVLPTSLWISRSRFWMQSSFLFRQRWAAMRFLLRRLISWMKSSWSEVSLCIFTISWKSFRGSSVIWSNENGSFTCKHTVH